MMRAAGTETSAIALRGSTWNVAERGTCGSCLHAADGCAPYRPTGAFHVERSMRLLGVGVFHVEQISASQGRERSTWNGFRP
jgi:hypothetical protein